MRSLFDSLFGRETGATSGEAGRGRPESLRRRTLAVNSRINLATSMLATPAALYLLATQGALMPFVITMIGLGGAFLTLALHRRGLTGGKGCGANQQCKPGFDGHDGSRDSIKHCLKNHAVKLFLKQEHGLAG